MIGRCGRNRATLDAVLPRNVGTRIAFARNASAMSQAAFDLAEQLQTPAGAPHQTPCFEQILDPLALGDATGK